MASIDENLKRQALVADNDIDEMRMPKAFKYVEADSSNDQDGSILKLNDDCLFKTLSYLSDIDLCAIHGTCHRLKELAEEEFRVRNKHVEYGIANHRIAQNRTVLKHFGHRASSFKGWMQNEKDWLFVSQYCQNITQIVLYAGQLPKLSKQTQRLLLSNVSELTIGRVRIEGNALQEIVREFRNIKKLDVRGFLFDSFSERKRFFDHEYTNIDHFECYMGLCSEGAILIQTFMRKNPQLKTMRFFGQLQFDADIIRNMQNMEHICLIYMRQLYDNDPQIDVELNGLNKLKCLELYNFDSNQDSANIACLLNTFDSQSKDRIESLGITASLVNQKLFETICEFTKLKALRIEDRSEILCRVGEKLSSIADKLKQLERLEICMSGEIEIIHGLVEKATKLKSLTIGNSAPLSDGWRRLDEHQFLQLVNARKRSNAAYPLVIYLMKFPLMLESCKKLNEVRQRHLDDIQLKEGPCPPMVKLFFGHNPHLY